MRTTGLSAAGFSVSCHYSYL